MTKWRIYYADESTFDSSMGTIYEAPSFGVICIVQPNELAGRSIVSGYDWYYYCPDINEWWQSDIHGLTDRLLHNLPTVAVKQGRSAPDPIFQRILEAAILDPEFPVKNANLKRERP
jgi:hypothetical protein